MLNSDIKIWFHSEFSLALIGSTQGHSAFDTQVQWSTIQVGQPTHIWSFTEQSFEIN